MSKTVMLKPAGHNLVRNPDTGGHLDKAGQLIVLNSYWNRRISDGDVAVVEAKDIKETK